MKKCSDCVVDTVIDRCVCVIFSTLFVSYVV